MELAITTAIESLGQQNLVPRRWHFYSITSSARASSIGGLGAFIMIAKNFNSFGNALIKKLIAEIVLERGVDRSMRGERRGLLLDRGLLGHGRCGGRGLVPLDRLRLARHRAGEHLVHA
jgi:hypothetical protein